MDVRLIGTLYTRSLARRFLATTLVNKWYPFHCFQLVCELLYGRVPCFAIYTRDVVDDGSKMNAKDQDLVLSKVLRFVLVVIIRLIRVSILYGFSLNRKRTELVSFRNRLSSACITTCIWIGTKRTKRKTFSGMW